MLVACCSPHHTFTLPISLNSLDREGVRLPSPRDSQIPSKTRWRDRWYRSKWFNWAQVAVRWGLRMILRVFPRWSVVVPSWGDRGLCCIWGLSSFWFRSRTLSVLDGCNDLFMYLCDVASVRQLCTFPFIYLHGLLWRLPHLRHCFQCGYASKSCFNTWEI